MCSIASTGGIVLLSFAVGSMHLAMGCSVEMGLDLHFLLPTLLPYEAVADPAEHCCSSDALSGME